jgi:hypothetical protein
LSSKLLLAFHLPCFLYFSLSSYLPPVFLFAVLVCICVLSSLLSFFCYLSLLPSSCLSMLPSCSLILFLIFLLSFAYLAFLHMSPRPFLYLVYFSRLHLSLLQSPSS